MGDYEASLSGREGQRRGSRNEALVPDPQRVGNETDPTGSRQQLPHAVHDRCHRLVVVTGDDKDTVGRGARDIVPSAQSAIARAPGTGNEGVARCTQRLQLLRHPARPGFLDDDLDSLAGFHTRAH